MSRVTQHGLKLMWWMAKRAFTGSGAAANIPLAGVIVAAALTHTSPTTDINPNQENAFSVVVKEEGQPAAVMSFADFKDMADPYNIHHHPKQWAAVNLKRMMPLAQQIEKMTGVNYVTVLVNAGQETNYGTLMHWQNTTDAQGITQIVGGAEADVQKAITKNKAYKDFLNVPIDIDGSYRPDLLGAALLAKQIRARLESDGYMYRAEESIISYVYGPGSLEKVLTAKENTPRKEIGAILPANFLDNNGISRKMSVEAFYKTYVDQYHAHAANIVTFMSTGQIYIFVPPTSVVAKAAMLADLIAHSSLPPKHERNTHGAKQPTAPNTFIAAKHSPS